MPQRFLRPGITTSEPFNSAGMDAQSQYIRLITDVDDYGRCDGRASVITGRCWPVWNERHPEDQITPQRTDELLQELEACGLIELYEVEGKRVLQITKWQERIRAGVKERWPAKPENYQRPLAASCGKLQQVPASFPKVAASCSNLLPSSSSSPSSSPSVAGAPKAETAPDKATTVQQAPVTETPPKAPAPSAKVGKRQLTTPERIDRREALAVLKRRYERLKDETCEQWQRDMFPEKVAEKRQVKAEIDRLEKEIEGEFTSGGGDH